MQKLSANEAPDPEYQYLDTLVVSFPFHKVSSNIWLFPTYQGCARILFKGLLFCDLKVTLMSQLIGEKVLKVMQPGFRIDPLLSTLHCLRICANYPEKKWKFLTTHSAFYKKEPLLNSDIVPVSLFYNMEN